MSLSWHYTPPPAEREQDFRFREDNEHFVRLANVIHQDQGVTQDMQELVEEIKRGKTLESECNIGELSEASNIAISEKYGDISMEPIHEEISEESLEIAAKIYFGFVFCPDFDPETVIFYKELIVKFSLETILKILARNLLMANEKDLTEHYNTAKALFDRISSMMNLQYKDIAVMTTGQSEVELYQELEDHQLNNPIKDGKKYLERKILKSSRY